MLVVEKVDHKGACRSWSFQPNWLRVSMDDPPRHESQVTLSSHGQAIPGGSFLPPEERLDFAQARGAALERLTQPQDGAGRRTQGGSGGRGSKKRGVDTPATQEDSGKNRKIPEHH